MSVSERDQRLDRLSERDLERLSQLELSEYQRWADDFGDRCKTAGEDSDAYNEYYRLAECARNLAH